MGAGGNRAARPRALPPDSLFPPTCSVLSSVIRMIPGPRPIRYGTLLLRTALALLPAMAARGAESARELAPGVVYARAATLPPAPPATARTRILDLRGAAAGDSLAPASLDAWLASAGDSALTLVLLDADTAPALRDRLSTRRARVLTLASLDSGVPASVRVKTPPDQDRAARMALAEGKDPIELLESKKEKRRYDEASMVRDHAAGVPIPDGPPDDSDNDPDPTAPAPAVTPDGTVAAPPAGPASPPPPSPPPLVDEVLQRALHLHHALTASRRHTP